MARKILVTGFEPFGGETMNPAWEAVRALPDAIDGAQVAKVEIPVVFGRAPEAVEAAIERESPDLVLCVGQAGGRAKLTPEFVGINCADGRIPDNDGYQPAGEKIEPDGPDAYFATLPVKAMAQAMSEAGRPGRRLLHGGHLRVQRRHVRTAPRPGDPAPGRARRLSARALRDRAGHAPPRRPRRA
jgi:pyroglutamyl-peptidase